MARRKSNKRKRQRGDRNHGVENKELQQVLKLMKELAVKRENFVEMEKMHKQIAHIKPEHLEEIFTL